MPAPLALLLTACSAPAPEHPPTIDPVAFAPLHAAGVGLPLTLHPVRLLDRPTPRVAEALGLVLEKQGMNDLEVVGDDFAGTDADWSKAPARFGEHVRATAAGAERRHHLYAEVLGTPRTGPTEVRFIVVDGDGHVVLVDRQVPTDADFRRTAGRDPDPMGCMTLVAERLFELAQWQRRPGAVADGKFAHWWQEQSGAAAAPQRDAMAKRLQTLRSSLPDARIVLLPTRVNSAPDLASSQRLATHLAQRLSCRAAAAATGKAIEVAADSNEQKVLWDLSRGLCAAVREHGIDGDYALVVDVGLDPAHAGRHVHLAMCDKSGEPVLVEFQNDQHADLRRAAPQTLAQAEQFAVDWLAKLLR